MHFVQHRSPLMRVIAIHKVQYVMIYLFNLTNTANKTPSLHSRETLGLIEVDLRKDINQISKFIIFTIKRYAYKKNIK